MKKVFNEQDWGFSRTAVSIITPEEDWGLPSL